MKNSFIRITALVLAMLVCLSGVACGDSGKTNGNETADNSSGIESVTTEDPGPVLEAPEVNYEGYTVTYLTADPYADFFRLLSEEENGDTLNDAAYKRNSKVTERLNVGFTNVSVSIDEVARTLNNSVMAGTHDYDFVFPHCTRGVASMMTNGLLYDWNMLDYVDFSSPWWNSDMNKSFNIGGVNYFASGDIAMTWQGMLGILFNKDYIERYNIDTNMYDLVYDGSWTLDKVLSLISGISADLDGDAAMTEKDQYGFITHKSTGVDFQFASGVKLTENDESGCPVLSMNNERMYSFVEKYYTLIKSPDTFLGEYNSGNYAQSEFRDIIVTGRSFLMALDIGGFYSYLREIEYDFGILPLPKLDEKQENYYSCCGAGIIGIPSDIENAERTANIAETMAYYSYQYIRPAYFDVVLQNKCVRDEDSFKVIEMMQDTKAFDIGLCLDFGQINMVNDVVVQRNGTDFASYYAEREESINRKFRELFNQIMEAKR